VPPPTPAAPPPPPPPPTPTADDPHALGGAINRLSGGGLLGGAKKAAKAPATALAVLLQEGEVVECLCVGQLYGEDGVVALTDRRLLFVNAKEWVPVVVGVPVDSTLSVAGMQDDRTATLTFTTGGNTIQVDRIGDRALAMEMAQRIRGRVGS
jgi:hypothetical protein